MLRRLFNLATALSLFLLAVTVALWVRSERRVDYITYTYPPAKPSTSCSYELTSTRGDLSFDWMQFYEPLGPKPEFGWQVGEDDAREPAQWESFWRTHGFELYYQPPPSSVGGGNLVSQGGIGCPHWFAITILLLLPLARLLLLRKRRQRAGFCRACNYDLTANVSGVCPECGSKVPA